MSKASELTAVIKRRLADEEAALLLDDLPGHEAREFETFLYEWLERTKPALLKEIRDAAAPSDGWRDALTRAVQGAKSEFRRSHGAGPTHDSYREDGGEA